MTLRAMDASLTTRLMSIGRFAALTGLPITTLRHYDEIGLLRPAEVDHDPGYRRYRPTRP
jgi:DNA-binding transcriptional MerR regulator